MNPNLTDITLIVDRSGSMAQVQQDAEGGINTFIQDQAQQSGQAILTLVQFNTAYEFVHRAIPIAEVPGYHLVPCGMTALLDAVGRGIHETGQRLAGMPEAERPGLVVFVILTDGYENSSQEYTKAQIKNMIERQQRDYRWEFTFLGANQDAFAEAGGIGIAAGGVANFAMDKVNMAWRATGGKVARMRKQRADGDAVQNEFTSDEREQMR